MAGIDKNEDIRSALEAALNVLNKKEAQAEDIKLKNYLEDSAKTLSGIFYYDDKNESEPDIVFFTDKVIKACRSLDVIKKKKFYNRPVDISSSAPSNLRFKRDNKGENVLHAAIGLATECGEILEEVVRSKYEDSPLDVTNIKEEIGDITWYLAILLRDLDIDLFDAMALNIEKLKKRYPGEKFSTERANNRDLASERSVLEGVKFTTNDVKNSDPLTPQDKRVLPNGGLAPATPWESKKVDEFQKISIIEQMRTLYNKGTYVTFVTHNQVPINEFTKPFSYLESNRDYSGSFLIKLLSSENDLTKASNDFKINLDKELLACKNNTKVVVSVFDITGSTDKNEEKKFLLTFDFTPLSGIIKLAGILFENGVSKILSQRQFNELENFCKIKKINIL